MPVLASVLAMKLAFVVADLAVARLLVKRFGLEASVVYAWNPLVIYVGAGGAHYEPLLLLAMTAGWLAWEGEAKRAGQWPAAWWLGVALGLKWVTAPLVAWCAWSRVRAKDFAGALQIGVIAALPLALGLAWFRIDFGQIGPLAPRDYVAWARTGELVPWLVEQVWPASASRNGLVLVLFAPVAAWMFFRARSLTAFAGAFLFALLVFSPSVHAWYFVWLVPLAVATRNRGTLAVSVSAFVYFWMWQRQAVSGVWIQTPGEKLLMWGPLVVGYWVSRRRPAA